MEQPLFTIIITALDLLLEDAYIMRRAEKKRDREEAEEIIFAGEEIRNNLNHLSYLINRGRF